MRMQISARGQGLRSLQNCVSWNQVTSQIFYPIRVYGKKFFFYIRKDQVDKIKINAEENVDLSSEEKIQVEQDVREIVGLEDEEMPVFLDFESVKIVKSGKYLLDLQKLFAQDKPRVYKLADGKYIIDLNMKVLHKK